MSPGKFTCAKHQDWLRRTCSAALTPLQLPQPGWKPAEASDDVADHVRRPEEFAVLAVFDEGYSHHQIMEHLRGNDTREAQSYASVVCFKVAMCET